MLKWQILVKLAHEKGYRVTENGKLVNPKGKLLKISLNSNYPQMGILFEGKVSTIYVHKLAAYCFYGEESFSAECVRHKNGNKLDLSKENILLGTYSENELDKDSEVRINNTKAATRKTERYKNSLRGIPGSEEKPCHKCLKSQPLSLYGKNKLAEDGLAYWCKPCRAEYEKERRNVQRQNIA